MEDVVRDAESASTVNRPSLRSMMFATNLESPHGFSRTISEANIVVDMIVQSVLK